jgi:hypothetical protein
MFRGSLQCQKPILTWSILIDDSDEQLYFLNSPTGCYRVSPRYDLEKMKVKRNWVFFVAFYTEQNLSE